PCSPARRIEADVEPLPESRVETKIELSKKSASHNECLVSKEIVSMKAEITVEAEVAAALKKSVVPAECPEVSMKVETEENSTVPCSTHATPILNEPVLSTVTQSDVGLTYKNNVETASLSIDDVDAVEPKVSDDLKEKIKSAIAGREVLTSARNGREEGEKMKRGVLVTPKTLPVKRDGSDLTPLLPSEKGQSTPEKKTSRIEAFEKDQRRVNGTPYKVAQAKIKTENGVDEYSAECEASSSSSVRSHKEESRKHSKVKEEKSEFHSVNPSTSSVLYSNGTTSIIDSISASPSCDSPAKSVKENCSTSSDAKEPKGEKRDKLPRISNKFRKYVIVDTHPNGGASILRTDWNNIRKNFDNEERMEFAKQFIRLGLAESNGVPVFVIGVLENAASYLVDVFQYLHDKHPHLPVK
ncbi:hypothetical protein TELCIR_21437, partial [Teladorsagia circumcincta]